MKNYIFALLVILLLTGTANATTKKVVNQIDHQDLRPVTSTLELVLGEKFLADSPYGLNSLMFEYGIQYELKKRHPHYWSLVASLMKGSTSGTQSLGRGCWNTAIATSKHSNDTNHVSIADNNGPDGDNDLDDQTPAPPSTPSTPATPPSSNPGYACGNMSNSSSLDLLTLGLGLQYHRHIYDFKIQPYAGAGIAVTNANLQVNGLGESGTGVGIYGGFGLIYAIDPIVFNVGYKYSYEPNFGYNFGGHELLGQVGINF